MYLFLKISGMVLVVICTTSIGMAMAQALTRRVSQLETGLAVLDALENEFCYSLTPPDEAVLRLEQLESLSQAAFLPACASLCRQGLAFPRARRRAVSEQRGELIPDDITILAGLADTLGQSDLDGQISRLTQAKTQLKFQLEEARRHRDTHAKLYHTMGLLAGAFLVVICI